MQLFCFITEVCVTRKCLGGFPGYWICFGISNP